MKVTFKGWKGKFHGRGAKWSLRWRWARRDLLDDRFSLRSLGAPPAIFLNGRERERESVGAVRCAVIDDGQDGGRFINRKLVASSPPWYCNDGRGTMMMVVIAVDFVVDDAWLASSCCCT